MAEHLSTHSHETSKAHEDHGRSTTQERTKSRSEVAPERSRTVSPEALKHLQERAKAEAQRSDEVTPRTDNETPPPSSVFGVLDTQTERTVMNRLRKQLPTYDRVFSHIIHAEPIERVSEVAGSTIARPSGILGAGVTACIGLAFVMIVAKRTGFALSGSEFLILIVAGWCLGLLVEFGYRTFRLSRHQR